MVMTPISSLAINYTHTHVDKRVDARTASSARIATQRIGLNSSSRLVIRERFVTARSQVWSLEQTNIR